MRLTVKPLKNRDPGSGMAVIDREALGELDVSTGDFVAIEGTDRSRAVARVWPSDKADAGRGIVRIDGELHQAANVSVDDRVTVEEADVESAPVEEITLTTEHFEQAIEEIESEIGGDSAPARSEQVDLGELSDPA